MTEKLIHICGSPNNYCYEEYVAPRHAKSIKIIKPDTPVLVKILTQNNVCDLEEKCMIPAWTADKIARNFLPVDEWIIVRKYNKRNIPTNLKQEGIFLVGRENPNWYPILENIVVYAIAILSVIIGFSILFPFL